MTSDQHPEMKSPCELRRPAARRLLTLFLCALPLGCGSFIASRPTPATRTPIDACELKYGIARMAERYGSLDKARSSYLQILEEHPNHRESLHRLGVVSLKLELLDEAIEYLQQAVAVGPETSELLGDLGYVQLLAGDLPAARATMLRALEINPTDERLINNLALVLGYEGRLGDSLELFRRVGSEAESLSNIGIILTQSGQLEEAERYFHRAILLDPELKAAARGLMELQGVEPDGANVFARVGREVVGSNFFSAASRSEIRKGEDRVRGKQTDNLIADEFLFHDHAAFRGPNDSRLLALPAINEIPQVEQRGTDQHDGDGGRQTGDDRQEQLD
jgi:Flp pilus assembly protein TadD